MPLVVAALAISAADVRNPALAEGIRLYDALDYAGALQSLTQALDRPSNKADAARIHLYIGLIQTRYKLKADAEASFGRAIDYDSRVRLPKGTPQSAKTLFKKIRKDKLGEDEEPVEPIKKKKTIKKKQNGDPDDEPEDRGMNGDEETRTATAANDTALAMNTTTNTNTNPNTNTNANPSEPSDPTRQDLSRADPNQRILPPTAGTQVDTGSGGPIVGWISVGAAVAAIATGVTFTVLAVNNASAADAEPVSSRAEQLYNTAIEQRTLAFVSYGVGTAAFGLAAVLFLTDE